MAKSIAQKVYERARKVGYNEETAIRYATDADDAVKIMKRAGYDKFPPKAVMDYVYADWMTRSKYSYGDEKPKKLFVPENSQPKNQKKQSKTKEIADASSRMEIARGMYGTKSYKYRKERMQYKIAQGVASKGAAIG